MSEKPDAVKQHRNEGIFIMLTILSVVVFALLWIELHVSPHTFKVVKAGQKWVFIQDDPFGTAYHYNVIDVKGQYVKYFSPELGENSCRVKKFKKYKRLVSAK